MQTQGTIFDDMARVMAGAAGLAQGVQDEAKSFLRTQAERLVADMDLVGRDEFEAVRDQARKAQEEAAELRARLAALEEKLAALAAK